MSTDDTDAGDTPGPTTESAQTRWDYTNDVVAILLTVAIVGSWFAALYAVTTGAITFDVSLTAAMLRPVGMAVAFGIALMFIWLFGRGAFNTLLEAIRN